MARYWCIYQILIHISLETNANLLLHDATFRRNVGSFDVDSETGYIYADVDDVIVRLTPQLEMKNNYEIFPDVVTNLCNASTPTCNHTDVTGPVVSFKLISASNNTYVFACHTQAEDCKLTTVDGRTLQYTLDNKPGFVDSKPLPTILFNPPSNQRSGFLLYTFTNMESRSHHSRRRRAFTVSHVTVDNMTYIISPPVFALGVHSPIVFTVLHGFNYRSWSYFLVEYSLVDNHSALIQVRYNDASASLTFVESRIQCGDTGLGRDSRYPAGAYVSTDNTGSDGDSLYLRFHGNDGLIVCAATLASVEEYFSLVADEYRVLRKGSVPWWIQHDTQPHPQTTNHRLVFSATKLYFTAVLALRDVPEVTAIVVAMQHTHSRLFYLITPDGSLLQIALSAGLVYKTNVTETMANFGKVTGIRQHGNTLYVATGNKLYSIRVPDCGRHVDNHSCVNDVTSCSWCRHYERQAAFHCVSQSSADRCKSSPMATVPEFTLEWAVEIPAYIKSVGPTSTIVSGGTIIQIETAPIDSTEPQLHVLLYTHDSRIVSMNSGLCNLTESWTWHCSTPALDLRKYQADTVTPSTTLRTGNRTVTLLMTLRTGNRFMSIMRNLLVLDDPVVYSFAVVDSGAKLAINGSGFDHVDSSEIKVTIWRFIECLVTMVTTSKVYCLLDLPLEDTQLERLVTVKIGQNLVYNPGHVILDDGAEDGTLGSYDYDSSEYDLSYQPSTTTTTTTTKEPSTFADSAIPANVPPVAIPSTKVRVSGSIQPSDVPTDASYDVAVMLTVIGVVAIALIAIVTFRKTVVRKLLRTDGIVPAVHDTLTLTASGAAHNMGYDSAGITDYSFNPSAGITDCSPVNSSAGITDCSLNPSDGINENRLIPTTGTDAHLRFIAGADDEEAMCVQMMLKHLEDGRLIVPRDCLHVHNVIGQGNFGSVYRGMLTRGHLEQDVAVKTLHKNQPRDQDIRQFLKEAYVMHNFRDDHVMTLLGVCLGVDEMPLVILPYMKHGDLLRYLQDDVNLPTVRDLVQFCRQIADGMEYLARTKFVHRDLAARNCMLDTDLRVRIADFGLSRDIYETEYYSTCHKDTQLPVKWMAIESLASGIYNERTDVWSYGVTLWEVLTRGVRPYVVVNNWDMEAYLLSGRRLPQPLYCPPKLYKLMRMCWYVTPDERPTFDEISSRVSVMLERANQRNEEAGSPREIDDIYVNLTMGASYKYDTDE